MTLFYPRQQGTGELAFVFRPAFGAGMAAGIVLGFASIRGGDVHRHRAWMTRAYALALGAGVPTYYQIRVGGHLDPHWSAWFDGLALTYESDGTTRGDLPRRNL